MLFDRLRCYQYYINNQWSLLHITVPMSMVHSCNPRKSTNISMDKSSKLKKPVLYSSLLLIQSAVNVNFRILQVHFDKKNETNKHIGQPKEFLWRYCKSLRKNWRKELGRNRKSMPNWNYLWKKKVVIELIFFFYIKFKNGIISSHSVICYYYTLQIHLYTSFLYSVPSYPWFTLFLIIWLF